MWLVFLLAFAASAGSYGGASAEFPGFRATIDASVGSWSDPVQETQAFEAGVAAARGTLEANDALLREAYARYARGDHRWKRLRTHLVPRGEGLPTLWTGLYIPTDWGGQEQIRIELTVDVALGKQEEKLAADYALAQIGGTLPPAPVREANLAAALDLQGQLGARTILGVAGQELHSLLLTARLAEPELRALAARTEPYAPAAGRESYALPGWMLARVLVALFDGTGPREALGNVEALPPEVRAELLRMVALMLPDSDLDAGTRALAKLGANLSTRRDGPLPDWLATLR